MVKVRISVYGVQSGDKFGKWSVLGVPFSVGKKHWAVVVKCECGQIKVVDCSSLSSGNSRGCRSCQVKLHKTKYGTHAGGAKPPRLYNIWAGMKQRCTNPNHPAFPDYGGRGIDICPEWINDFVAFENWAIQNGYDDNKQIDRYPDNDAGYRPSNCRWVTCKDNQRNRRSNLIVSAFGEAKCLAEWSEDSRCAVQRTTLLNRIQSGWEPEMAISTPARNIKV